MNARLVADSVLPLQYISIVYVNLRSVEKRSGSKGAKKGDRTAGIKERVGKPKWQGVEGTQKPFNTPPSQPARPLLPPATLHASLAHFPTMQSSGTQLPRT